MKLSRYSSIAIAACASLWVGSALAADGLCDAIQTFARAQHDLEKHTVELLTDWGGQFSGPNVFASKQCIDHEYQPGRDLCKYLLSNASTEFAQQNFEHAIACLDNQPRLTNRNSWVEYLHVQYSAAALPDVDKEVSITVEIDRDRTEGPSSLKITSERLP